MSSFRISKVGFITQVLEGALVDQLTREQSSKLRGVWSIGRP